MTLTTSFAGASGFTIDALHISKERFSYKELVLGNPNYFGNLPGSVFPKVMEKATDSTFEALGAVGFNPQFKRLEAVVTVKLNFGYNGSLCSAGSQEYVRFYVDWDGGTNFTDAGIAGVNVHDIPGPRPLEYDVTLPVTPLDELFCFLGVRIPHVRAILSWDVPPPPNMPNFTPVWGDVQDVFVQSPPALFFLAELLEVAKLKLPAETLGHVAVKAPIEHEEHKALTIEQLQDAYKNKVEPQRFMLSALHGLLHKPVDGSTLQTLMLGDKPIAKLYPTLIDELIKLSLNTSYEQVIAVGLNEGTSTLSAIINVKRPYGYGGEICTLGSQEYVSFWADWDMDGTFDTYLGTTSVRVHDIPNIPPEGLSYSVELPADLTPYEKPCPNPDIVKIRAVLSWGVAPSTTDPSAVPYWGNVLDELVQLPPIEVEVGTPFISGIGGIAIDLIDQTTGLATGASILGGFSALQSPFGRSVAIVGHLPDKDLFGQPTRYKVFYRNLDMGTPAVQLSDPFQITITKWDSVLGWTEMQMTQSLVGGYFVNRNDYANQQYVEGDVLAILQSAGLTDGNYEISIAMANLAEIGADVPGNAVHICVNNTAPSASLEIESVIHGGGSPVPAGDCGTFQVSDTIRGQFTASSAYFGTATLTVEPPSIVNHGHFTTPVSAGASVSESYPMVMPPGIFNAEFDFDSADAMACGYVLRLDVVDRTIVDSGAIGLWANPATDGFCLRS